MSQESKKIVVVSTREEANEWYAKGYKIHTVLPIISEYGHTWGETFIMYLDDKGYGDVVEVRDAPHELANELLAIDNGWEIASTSVSSKFYRMVRREPKKDQGAPATA